jgi:CW-type Zinc Finger
MIVTVRHSQCVFAPQCCEPFCLKWRRLPQGDSAADPKFENDWYCSMNPDKKLAALGHDYPQEPDEVSGAEVAKSSVGS